MKKTEFSHLANLELLVLFLVIAITYFGVFGPIVYQLRQTPPTAEFAFAGGFTFDYYQYLAWIKDGIMGNLLVSSRYTEVPYPKVLIHPLFPILGLMGAKLGLTTPIIYLWARLVTTGIFLGAFFWLTKRVLSASATRLMALLALISTTGFWAVEKSASGWKLLEPIPWSGNFNVIYKFNLPPHHFLALTTLVIVIVLLTQKNQTVTRTILLTLATTFTGFLNPSMGTILFFVLGAAFLMSFTPVGRPLRPIAGRLLLPLGILILVLLYHQYLFLNVQPWSVMYERMRHFNPPATFIQYLLATGPTLVLALAAAAPVATRNNPRVLLFLLWALGPFFLFPLRGTLPVNASRLFQSYQFVPLAILAAIGIEEVATWLNRLTISPKFTKIILTTGLLLYASLPFGLTVVDSARSVNPSLYNVYIPKALLSAFQFLDSQTPSESVVLSGEFVSSVIPAFTHNRTLIARDDIALDYYAKRDRAFAFLNGEMGEAEALKFLKTYRVSYVLWGVDTYPFEALPVASFPFFKEIFRAGAVTVVAVRK